MKNLYFLAILSFLFTGIHAQTTFQRVYTTLNTKCQNATCHSATSLNDGPKFDGNESAVYHSIFNMPSSLFPASINKYEQLVKAQHPYTSFLLRKIAGEQFDADLAIDTATEGHLMLDTAGQPLTNIEIEFIRQWIRYGAKQTYSNSAPKPDYATIAQYYTDSTIIGFLPKPPKPAAGEGLQFRMGPVFLPTTGAIEQEQLQQQEVNFPVVPEVYKINGYMNQQSHHFILFSYVDSASARSSAGGNGQVASDRTNIAQVTPQTSSFVTAFDGNKNMVGGWQEDENLVLPQGTAFMWDQKTYLDMNFHMKNYNATSVLPCDFYFNVYYRPRDTATVPMVSNLVNNISFGDYDASCTGNLLPNALPNGIPYTYNYDDPDNYNFTETRYLWMVAGHTHKYGTAFYIQERDTAGQLKDTIYDGSYDYANGFATGFWDHAHPGIEYWPNLHPVQFGGGGLVALTTWKAMENCVGFGFTTNSEMQLFYYSYTNRLPAGYTTGIKENKTSSLRFDVLPNPMSTNGKLVYTLDKAARVDASIIDIAGKTIARLNDESQQAGTHEVTISTGQKIASGIYFARLSVDGVIYNRKFVVTE